MERAGGIRWHYFSFAGRESLVTSEFSLTSAFGGRLATPAGSTAVRILSRWRITGRPAVSRKVLDAAPPWLGEDERQLWAALMYLKSWELDMALGRDPETMFPLFDTGAREAAALLRFLHENVGRFPEFALAEKASEHLDGKVLFVRIGWKGGEVFEVADIGSALWMSAARGLAMNSIGVCRNQECRRVFLKADRKRLGRVYCDTCHREASWYQRRMNSLDPVAQLYRRARHALENRADGGESVEGLRDLYDTAREEQWGLYEFQEAVKRRFDYPAKRGRKPRG